ncbi:DNA primase [Candidatus Woesearchaeota archaeon]|nr:DNA primase [Candidatus Woesearchaeota archaeon]
MAKISPVSAKYIVHTQIQIEGVVDRPDVIGAIFGQTEGLLGSDLELRELQRSGRIGRIEVKSETRAGKTFGTIIIPSSLDKAETAIIAASLETIQRIGPCNARVRIEKIEDVRVSKRNFVIERAKELLKVLTDSVLPDSQEITDEVAQSVRMMEITEYGKDRLPAGPAIDESEDVIVVEGRADVLNLLKHGIKNVIGLNGTSTTDTIIELGKRKVLTVFVDGDRGGDLIVKGLANVTEIDYVSKAPDGKEVEEITKKEIHKALRARITVEQINIESQQMQMPLEKQNNIKEVKVQPQQRIISNVVLSTQQKQNFKRMLDDLIGTRGAYILDEEMNILGKVPTSELIPTIKSLNSVFAVVFDGTINRDITNIADRANVKYLVGMDSRVRPNDTRADILVSNDL